MNSLAYNLYNIISVFYSPVLHAKTWFSPVVLVAHILVDIASLSNERMSLLVENIV